MIQGQEAAARDLALRLPDRVLQARDVERRRHRRLGAMGRQLDAFAIGQVVGRGRPPEIDGIAFEPRLR